MLSHLHVLYAKFEHDLSDKMLNEIIKITRWYHLIILYLTARHIQ